MWTWLLALQGRLMADTGQIFSLLLEDPPSMLYLTMMKKIENQSCRAYGLALAAL